MPHKRITRYLLILISITVASCTAPIRPSQELVLVNQRDLTLSANRGDGEGLAKPVPEQPLLINNQLVFSMMGDAVLGIAIAVGAIAQTIDLFADMDSLAIERWTADEIDRVSQSDAWQLLLTRLSQGQQRLVIEPYAYLNGHPDAILEARLSVTVMANGVNLSTRTIAKQSDTKPLKGAGSWSENKGQAVRVFIQDALPELIAQLPQSIEVTGI